MNKVTQQDVNQATKNVIATYHKLKAEGKDPYDFIQFVKGLHEASKKKRTSGDY